MTFKEHRIGELEAALKREKEQMSAQEGEMQGLLEKLAHEVETNTRLSMELQEGHNGKEVGGHIYVCSSGHAGTFII